MEKDKDYKKVLELMGELGKELGLEDKATSLMRDITICSISERGVMDMLQYNESDELFGLDILSEAVKQYHKALEFFIKDNKKE